MQHRKFNRINIILLSSLIILFFTASGNLFSEEAEKNNYDVAGKISTSSIFSKEILQGPHHKITEYAFTYDGVTNNFVINSEFGKFKAIGNGMVPVRIHEINAIAEMAEMKNSKEFLGGLKESAGTLVESTKNLIVHPVDTVSGFPTGVYNFFANIGEVVKQTATGEMSVGQAAKSGGSAVIGFSRNKRELGYRLGVNIYSDNKVLQENLNSVGWAITRGTFIVDFGKMLVSGPAGIALTVVGSTRVLGRLLKTNAPPELRRLNRAELEKIGVSKPVIEKFLANRKLTPRHQTAITLSLVSLKKTKNHEAFLNMVIENTDSIGDANMFQAVAAMIAAYNRTKVPITEIRTFENVAIFRNKNGSYVITYPLDNFLWIKRTEGKAKRLINLLPAGEKKELWISGKFSDLASSNMNKLGWILKDQAFKNLDLKNPY